MNPAASCQFGLEIPSSKVKNEAKLHLSALAIGKHIAEAAYDSATQYRSNREALRKARQAEAIAQEKEAKRQKKEQAAEEKRKLKETEKEEKKQEKKREKEEQQKRAAEEADAADEADDDNDDDEGGRKRKKRRVRGAIDEITDMDHPVLANRFSGFEAETTSSMTEFLARCLQGDPVVWANKRSQVKKLLDQSFHFDAKTSASTNMAMAAEVKDVTSKFAEIVESDPNKVKHTDVVSEQTRVAGEALNLDINLQELLENMYNDGSGKSRRPHTCVLERDAMKAALEAKLKDAENAAQATAAEASATAVRYAKQELTLYSSLQVQSFQKGKQHDGVMSGLFPHFIYQMEGTRVMAICSIRDVLVLVVLPCLPYQL